MTMFAAHRHSMTTTPTTPWTVTIPTDDPRIAFAGALQVAGAVVGELGPDGASNPTPCAEWDALTLAQHIIAIVHRVAALPSGRDLTTLPAICDDVPLDDLVDAFAGASMVLEQQWRDDDLLDRTMTLPFGQLPGSATMGVYAAELLVHAWDLAVAIGVEPVWRDDDVEAALAIVRAGIPAEPRDAQMPFDPVVAVPPAAPPIERLVAWVGRDPARWR
jgi:uncharacterized protein (TIGR03086 family)